MTCSVKKGVLKKRLKHKCFRVNIVKFLITPFLKYICERVLLYFLKSKLQKYNLYTSRNFFFNFRIYKIFSYLFSFTNFSSTEFTFSFALFSHTISNISCYISTILFSSSLKRLNAFSQQKFVLIGNAQSLSSGLI